MEKLIMSAISARQMKGDNEELNARGSIVKTIDKTTGINILFENQQRLSGIKGKISFNEVESEEFKKCKYKPSQAENATLSKTNQRAKYRKTTPGWPN